MQENSYHLLTETKGNGMFCEPETVEVLSRRNRVKHRQSRVHKIYCFPEVSINKYFIVYQETKKRKIKRTSYENT